VVLTDNPSEQEIRGQKMVEFPAPDCVAICNPGGCETISAGMTRQETAAHDLEDAAAELAAFIRDCRDSVWTGPTSGGDGRTVASLAYHCAAGNTVALGWICELISSRPVQETGEGHDELNAAEAARSRDMGKEEVVAALERSTARTAAFLRALTDEELDRGSLFGLAGREVSAAQFIGNFGRHIRRHLETMRQVE
jgi:hypothetical protein